MAITAVTVPNQNVHHLIRQAYNAGGPYQWAREALVNAIEAEATWINFGVDEQSFTLHNIGRRFVADNGSGMDEEALQTFLASFGGGGKPIGDHENFGQGFKASCYEWNPYGIVVMSWTEKTRDGRMIWIHFNEKNTQWQLKEFEVYLPDGTFVDNTNCIPVLYNEELGIDLQEFHFPEIQQAGHGTVFLFLGDRPTRETMDGDYMRDETAKRGIVGYLNTRFIEIPDGISVRVASLEQKPASSIRRESKDRTIKSPDGYHFAVHPRRVEGIKAAISTNCQHGSMTVRHDTKIDWYLADVDEVSLSAEKGPKKPIIAVQYDNEAYDRKDRLPDYRQFGIPDSLRMRVWLIITPPKSSPTKWGVFPQASRGTLLGKGGTGLPWQDWEDDFVAHMPAAIREAIEVSRAGDAGADHEGRRERLKRTIERFATRYRPLTLVRDDAGTQVGTPTNSFTGQSREGVGSPRKKNAVVIRPLANSSDTGGAGDKVILTPDESGVIPGSEQRRGDGLPYVVWDPSFSEDEVSYAARFDEKDCRDGSFGTIHINAAFPLFGSEFSYWQGLYPRAAQSDVEELIKQAYEDELVSKVVHAHKMKSQELAKDEDQRPIRVTSTDVKNWTSPQALTASVLGLVNVEHRIRASAGGKLGASRR